MDTISKGIIRHKRVVVAVAAVAAVVCALLMTLVGVNYSMADYLPENAQSTEALRVMGEEFGASVPNLRVLLKNVTLTETVKYKTELKDIAGVDEVLWLDDAVDITQPIEVLAPTVVQEYYRDGDALLSVTIAAGSELAATDAIYKLVGERGALSGDAVNTATSQKLSVSESVKAICILVPVVLVILLLFTGSWVEPLLFLLTIGVAVLINMGTNIVFGEISFITQAVSPILQMAVSLDYAIFLLSSFSKYRAETGDTSQAMRMAMRRAFPAIAASAATTLFGFVALIFMDFRIGADLGINLVKGIVLSFAAVMLFLPALTLLCCRLIDKTKHRRLMPSFKGVGRGAMKLRIPCLVLVLLLLVPCFLAQRSNDFIYGMGDSAPASRSGEDTALINESFGRSTAIVLLVPRGDTAREAELGGELKKLEHVQSVVSYAELVGAAIPDEFAPESVTRQFYSENYARIIVYTDTASEGEEAFAAAEAVQQKAGEYYEGVLSCGESVNLLDIKNVVSQDSTRVNIIAIVAIALVLLLTFRSVSLPLLLLLTIETAIWVNLAVPYFSGSPLCYIGYLVINTVQLGATVDYAILLSENYMQKRAGMTKKRALTETLSENFSSILISGLILACAGFCLALVSTNPVVSELGLLLGRGTVLSMALVICLLPALLTIFDRAIEKTTLKAVFYKENKK